MDITEILLGVVSAAGIALVGIAGRALSAWLKEQKLEFLGKLIDDLIREAEVTISADQPMDKHQYVLDGLTASGKLPKEIDVTGLNRMIRARVFELPPTKERAI